MPTQELNPEIKAHLSMLVDHELHGHELDRMCRQLGSQDEVRRQAGRYYLIGSALRGEHVQPGVLDVSLAVSQALANEPTILAPSANKRRTSAKRWLQPVVGTALAASIAGLGLTFAPQLMQQEQLPAINTGLQVVANNVVAQPAPVAEPTRPSRWKTLNLEREPSMNTYLEEHSEQVAQSGVPTVAPYVSFVSYGKGQR